MKKCKKCGELKPLVAFTKQKRCLLGVHSVCNKCRAIINRKYTDYYKNYKRKPSLKRKYFYQIYKEKYGIGERTIRTYGLKLALEIYDNADRKCKECGSEYDLTIHHIDGNGRHNQEKGLPMNNDINNLIVLCRKCHGSIHGKEKGKQTKM